MAINPEENASSTFEVVPNLSSIPWFHGFCQGHVFRVDPLYMLIHIKAIGTKSYDIKILFVSLHGVVPDCLQGVVPASSRHRGPYTYKAVSRYKE